MRIASWTAAPLLALACACTPRADAPPAGAGDEATSPDAAPDTADAARPAPDERHDAVCPVPDAVVDTALPADLPAPDAADAGTSPPPGCPEPLSAPASQLLRLHAEGGRLLDEASRQVVLRGVNLSGMSGGGTGIFKGADLAALQAHGINAARLVLGWGGIEPDPGVIDEAYLADVDRILDLAADHGVSVWLDLHQWFWAKAGMPAWSCSREPALDSGYMMACAAEFYGSEVLQARFAEIWGMLAKRYAGHPAVSAFDLLNEPPPPSVGAALDGSFEQEILPPFYTRVVEAIRKADPERMVVIEPSIVTGWTTRMPPLPFGNAVFSPHLYVPHNYVAGKGLTWIIPPDPAFLRFQVESGIAAGERLGMPVVVGEFGAARNAGGFLDPEMAGWFLGILDLLDAQGVGRFYWDYRSQLWGLFEPGGAMEPTRRAHFLRPYVSRVPGTLRDLHATPWLGTLRARIAVPADMVCVPGEIVLPPALYAKPPEIAVPEGVDLLVDPEQGRAWFRATTPGEVVIEVR